MVNLMADTGLLGLDTVGTVISDGDGERVVKVFVYEPKLTLTPEILLDSSPEAEKLPQKPAGFDGDVPAEGCPKEPAAANGEVLLVAESAEEKESEDAAGEAIKQLRAAHAAEAQSCSNAEALATQRHAELEHLRAASAELSYITRRARHVRSMCNAHRAAPRRNLVQLMVHKDNTEYGRQYMPITQRGFSKLISNYYCAVYGLQGITGNIGFSVVVRVWITDCRDCGGGGGHDCYY